MENLRPGWLTRLPAEIISLPLKIGSDIAGRFQAAGSENRDLAGGALGAFTNPEPVKAADELSRAREANPDFFATYETAVARGDADTAFKAVARRAALGGGEPWLGGLLKQAMSLRRVEFDPTAPNAPERAVGLGIGEGEKATTAGKTLGDIFRVKSEATDLEKQRASRIAYRESLGKQADAAARLSGARASTEDATRQARIDKLLAQIEQAQAAGDLSSEQARRVRELLPGEQAVLDSKALQNETMAEKYRAEAQQTADLVPSQQELNRARAKAASEGRSSGRRDDFLMPGDMGGGFPSGGGAGMPGPGALPPAVPSPVSQQPPPAAPDRKAVLAEAVGSEVIAALDQGQVVTKSQLLAQLANRGIVGSQADGIIAELMQQYPE